MFDKVTHFVKQNSPRPSRHHWHILLLIRLSFVWNAATFRSDVNGMHTLRIIKRVSGKTETGLSLFFSFQWFHLRTLQPSVFSLEESPTLTFTEASELWVANYVAFDWMLSWPPGQVVAGSFGGNIIRSSFLGKGLCQSIMSLLVDHDSHCKLSESDNFISKYQLLWSSLFPDSLELLSWCWGSFRSRVCFNRCVSLTIRLI